MPIWIGLSPPSPPTAWTATRLRPIRWRRTPRPASSRNFAAAKSEGQLLVFEGNPLSLAAADRPKVDFVALDTEKLENVQEVRLRVLNATGYAGIAPEKLLLAAEISAPLLDEDRTEFAAVEEMSRRVIEFGPLGGLAAYNISRRTTTMRR